MKSILKTLTVRQKGSFTLEATISVSLFLIVLVFCIFACLIPVAKSEVLYYSVGKSDNLLSNAIPMENGVIIQPAYPVNPYFNKSQNEKTGRIEAEYVSIDYSVSLTGCGIGRMYKIELVDVDGISSLGIGERAVQTQYVNAISPSGVAGYIKLAAMQSLEDTKKAVKNSNDISEHYTLAYIRGLPVIYKIR